MSFGGQMADIRITVEAAKPGASAPKPVMYTPGPVDVKAYEVAHEPEGGDAPKQD